MDTYIKLYDWMMQCNDLSGYKEKVYALIYQMTVSGTGWYGNFDSMAKRLNIARRSAISATKQLSSIGAIQKSYKNGTTTLVATSSWAKKQQTIHKYKSANSAL